MKLGQHVGGAADEHGRRLLDGAWRRVCMRALWLGWKLQLVVFVPRRIQRKASKGRQQHERDARRAAVQPHLAVEQLELAPEQLVQQLRHLVITITSTHAVVCHTVWCQ